MGNAKQTICSLRIQNIQHLKQRIKETAASVTVDVLGRVWQEMECRVDDCRATSEAYIELGQTCGGNFEFFELKYYIESQL
jgi:hypothetical protein